MPPQKSIEVRARECPRLRSEFIIAALIWFSNFFAVLLSSLVFITTVTGGFFILGKIIEQYLK